MTIQKLYAHLSCSDLDRSSAWFTKFFARGADDRPMKGLAEWHQNDQAGFQLHLDASNAGHGTLTVGVAGLEAERKRLFGEGLSPGEIEKADYVDIVRMRDPDQNLVVLAEAR